LVDFVRALRTPRSTPFAYPTPYPLRTVVTALTVRFGMTVGAVGCRGGRLGTGTG
jgi:hypothetical protein